MLGVVYTLFMTNVPGTAFIHFVTGFAIAAMLAILGVPREALLILQIVLVVAAGIVALVGWRRSRRTSVR